MRKRLTQPPDLVVEILSPATRRRDLEEKRALYARFGVREYWIVDPNDETVTVLTLVQGHYELVMPADDGVIRSRVLPELRLSPDFVFGDAE